MKITSSKEKRAQRHKRVRRQVKGTGVRPRFSVFRSNKYVWAQLIDDETGRTIVAANSRDLTTKQPARPKGRAGGRTAAAAEVGEKIASLAGAKKIVMVVFDRGGYRYHGSIQAIAEGARRGGLKF